MSREISSFFDTAKTQGRSYSASYCCDGAAVPNADWGRQYWYGGTLISVSPFLTLVVGDYHDLNPEPQLHLSSSGCGSVPSLWAVASSLHLPLSMLSRTARCEGRMAVCGVGSTRYVGSRFVRVASTAFVNRRGLWVRRMGRLAGMYWIWLSVFLIPGRTGRKNIPPAG